MARKVVKPKRSDKKIQSTGKTSGSPKKPSLSKGNKPKQYEINIIVTGADEAKLVSDPSSSLAKMADISAGISESFRNTFSQAFAASKFDYSGLFSEIRGQWLDGVTADLSASLAGILEPLSRQMNQPFEGLMAARFQGFGEQFGKSLAGTLSPLFEELAASTRRLLAHVELNPNTAGATFAAAGFWLTPSMSLGLIQQLKRLEQNGKLTGATVKETILEYYREEKGALFSGMVEGWETNPRFKSRMSIIRDARDAHLQGKYTLSVPAVLPLVEGIASEIIGQQPGSPGRNVPQAIQTRHTDFFHVIARDVLLDYVTSRLYPYPRVDFGDFEGWLQRNGAQTDYASEENSLRAFLLLDALSWLD